MNRREFLKISGAGALGAAVASCTSGSVTEDKPLEINGNVVQNFPGTGLLGFGAMRWPMTKDENGKDIIDQEKVNEMVDLALEHGVNYFDSAPVYLQGMSERATATALLRHPRESYYIATKLSNFGDSSYEGSIKMYRQSLENYQTDHIDYYLMHSVGDVRTMENRFIKPGILDFLLKEREAGHIRHLGFSFHGGADGFDGLMELHEKYHWDFVQIQMNYLDWTHAGAGSAKYLYEELEKRGIPVVIMEPLRGGQLSDVPAPLADMLKEREPQRSIASWAFRFCGSFPGVLTALSGMTYIDHLRDNLLTFTNFKTLGEDEFELLEKVADGIQQYPLIRCTKCQYCMPCPYGINIPGIFEFYNDNINEGTYVVSKEQKDYSKIRRKYLLEYNKAIPTVRQADHCLGCGQCLEKCPQHIKIPTELQRIDRYIEKVKRETL